MTACGVASTRRSASPYIWAAALLGLLLLLPGQGRAVESLVTDPDLIDNEFEAYFTEPCFAGTGALLARGWTLEQINEYGSAVCGGLAGGSFTSSETFESSSNLGSVGAQSKTSDRLADQQQKSVEERLAEIKVEEPEERREGIGLLLALQTGETERASTNREVGYESDLDGVLAGVDYRVGDSLVAGLAAGLTTDDASFEGGAGFLETESRSLTVYTTYALNENAYVDAYAGRAWLYYEGRRDVSVDAEVGLGFTGSSTSDFVGEQLLVGASAGYDWFRGSFSWGVLGAIDYRETRLGDYEEEGNTGLELDYPEQESDSLTLRIGLTGSYTMPTSWGTLTPNIGVSAVREEQNDSRSFEVRSVLFPAVDPRAVTLETDDPDREYLLTSVGAVLAVNSATQLFVNYEELSSHDFLETWTVSAGFLTEF